MHDKSNLIFLYKWYHTRIDAIQGLGKGGDDKILQIGYEYAVSGVL